MFLLLEPVYDYLFIEIVVPFWRLTMTKQTPQVSGLSFPDFQIFNFFTKFPDFQTSSFPDFQLPRFPDFLD